ncbi:MAG: hypothetical protein IPF59_09485 [Ignavibacteria bacterium]|nr:hypothetical protein [Ignavibacteria bacterium]
MMFIYVEVRDAVMNTLIGGSEHIQYAACGVGGLAATAATSAGVWLITGYRNSGPLTFAAVIMSYIVAAAWIIEMSWFRLNADYTAFMNVRMGTGLIVALALSVFFWRPNHTISQVYRTIAALGIVATTFILASTESVWSLWIAYVNAQTTYG